jgi:hypothetical protein
VSDLSELDRAWAGDTLKDSCTIVTDAAGPPTFDEGLGRSVYPADQVLWTGVENCSVSYNVSDRPIEEGDDPKMLGRWVVRVPLEATGITSGCVVRIDAVRPGGDPDLVGKRFTVRRVGMRSSAILRRLFCDAKESTSP